MKLELGNYELTKLIGDLTNLSKLHLKKKVAYAVSRCLVAAEREKDHVERTRDISHAKDDEWNNNAREYRRKRAKIAQSCARLDDKGSPIVRPNGSYVIAEGGKYDVEVTALDEEYRSLVDDINNNELEFERYLQEKTTLEMYGIDYQLLPEEIRPSDLGLASLLLTDTEDLPTEKEDKKE